ncbi:hypothetical protein M422DRAFT_53765 [Sphaerobolus stellatus SS14]|uniref:Metacaspase-1 n=1 Tax=Sphaerobolus stellatus (strain SS14) TaxID=990650 RepID=A0A0C9UNL3_SPHS4|nr:hypothetical protein M422DRAFT_53765 [Sphaerobolus stellatus SS14]
MVIKVSGTEIHNFNQLFSHLVREYVHSYNYLHSVLTLYKVRPDYRVCLSVKNTQGLDESQSLTAIEDKSELLLPSSFAYSSLEWAVPDAQTWYNYLVQKLQVPSQNIQVLLDKEATRRAIINVFYWLMGNRKMKIGDPILIFYAGHDGEADSSRGGKQPVCGIPDRTIAALLDALATKKGDNITVILDCCFSGGGTRTDMADSTELERSVDVNVPLPLDLDSEIWAQSGVDRIVFHGNFLYRGLQSHMLLVACGAKQRAWEGGGRGKFSKALLSLLEHSDVDTLTYDSVLRLMEKISSQDPQCIGVNHNRIPFNARAPSATPPLFKVTKESNQETLDAGEIHGITQGDEFTIYAQASMSSSLGILIVQTVESIRPFETTLPPRGDAPVINQDYVWAIQSSRGTGVDLLLQTPLDQWLLALYKEISKETLQKNHTRIQ